MSRKYTDEQLDTMLEQYISREPKKVFSIRTAESKRSDDSMKKIVYKAVAVSAAAAVIMAGVFAAGHFRSMPGEPEKLPENSLFIKAYAENVTTEQIFETPDYVKSGLYIEKQYIDQSFLYNFFENDYTFGLTYPDEKALSDGRSPECQYPTLPQDDIVYRIYGDNIVSVNVESEKKCEINYSDCSLMNTPEYFDDVAKWFHLDNYEKSTITGFMILTNAPEDCPGYVYGKCDGDIPYNDYVLLHWKTPEYTLYDKDYAIREKLSNTASDRIDKAREYFKDMFDNMTSEEVTEMFGDTLTITAKYADGSERSMKMRISINSDYQYVIDYFYE